MFCFGKFLVLIKTIAILMENLLNEPVSNLLNNAMGIQDVDTMLETQNLACDLESMIEIGILQDYLDILGKMEDN